jgi:hypothetical protein
MSVWPTIPKTNSIYQLIAVDPNGGEEVAIPLTVGASNKFDTGAAMLVSGLGTTTAGVTDSTDKRFVTDQELADLITLQPLAALEAVLALLGARTGSETLLSSTPAVNLNQDAETNLYTCATGKSCLITRVIMRLASTSLTTVSVSFGWNAGTDSDVIANATHTELTGNTLFTVLSAKTGAKVGTSTGKFSVICNTKQGAAATCTIDTFGILF